MSDPQKFSNLLADCSSDEDDRAAMEECFELESDNNDRMHEEDDGEEEDDDPDDPANTSSHSEASQVDSAEDSSDEISSGSEDGERMSRSSNRRGALFRSDIEDGIDANGVAEAASERDREQEEDVESSEPVRGGRLGRSTTNRKKRPHHLISENSSSASDSADATADSEADRQFVEEFNALPEADKEELIEYIRNPLEGVGTSKEIEAIEQRYRQTVAYLADENNYERWLEIDGGFLKLARTTVEREGTSYSKGQLHSIFVDACSNRIVSRQRHGTATSHLAFLARIINAAPGGFFFLTSACGRKAFWTTFFPLIMSFFEAGGNGLIAIPAGELSVEALEEERSWQQVIEKRTSGRLRFIFVTDYDHFESWHIKEGLVIAPGGEMVDVEMSGNFNSRGVATEKAVAPDEATAAAKPGSAERMTVYKLNFDEEEGQRQIRDLGDYWLGLAQDDSLFYNVPSLLDFLDLRHQKSLDALRRSKRCRLLREILGELDHEDRTTQDRLLQQTITLAGRVSSKDAPRREHQQHPLTAPMELSDDARVSASTLVKEKKAAYSQLMSQHKREWTKEESLSIKTMNDEIVEELVTFGGEVFVKALTTIQEKKQQLRKKRASASAKQKAKPRTKPQTKSSRPRSKKVDRGEDADDEAESRPRLRGKAAVKIAPTKNTITRCPITSCDFEGELHRHAHLEHFDTLSQPIWTALKNEVGDDLFMDLAFCPVEGCKKKYKGSARGTNLCRHIATEHVAEIPQDPKSDSRFSRYTKLLTTALNNAQDCMLCTTRLPTPRDLGLHLAAKHRERLNDYETEPMFTKIKGEIKKHLDRLKPCLHENCPMEFFESSALVEHLTRGDHAKNIPANLSENEKWKPYAAMIKKQMEARPTKMQRNRPSALQAKPRKTKTKTQLNSLSKKPKLS